MSATLSIDGLTLTSGGYIVQVLITMLKAVNLFAKIFVFIEESSDLTDRQLHGLAKPVQPRIVIVGFSILPVLFHEYSLHSNERKSGLCWVQFRCEEALTIGMRSMYRSVDA